MNIPAEFDEIRPYAPEELPAVYDELLADEGFRKVLAYLYPNVPVEAIAQQMHACPTNLAFQKAFCYNFLKQLVAKCATGMEMQWNGLQRSGEHYTFISNHRDIVLDSALLSVLLTDEGFDTTVEIAIGDNLLIYPWIKKLVRVNKSFIVQRAATMRQMLLSSARMSRYMHFAINEKQENVWIAQREGRAKDSNDRTQESILKMMAMGGEGDIIDRLKDLNIVPLSISYEYDPCDYLKAQEFQQKRDIEGFKKSQADDLTNMQTGIFGYKGRIAYRTVGCLNAWLDQLDKSIPKTEIFGVIAQHIDEQIHANYVLYPINYVAADFLEGGQTRAAYYTDEEKAGVEKYFAAQLDKIVLPNKDEAFLREKLLLMYANPLLNHEKVTAN
jgi:hypothetical protein